MPFAESFLSEGATQFELSIWDKKSGTQIDASRSEFQLPHLDG
jgi:hypothetical protein